MAFPSVVARATHVSSTSNALAYDLRVTGPNGAVGELLIAIVSADGNPSLTVNASQSGAGWTKLGQASNGTIVTGAVFWKIATTTNWGTVGDGLVLDSSVAEQFSSVMLRLSGVNLQIEGTNSNGSSTNSNPPSETIAGGTAKDVLWVATRSGDSTVVATAAPASYANLQSRAGGGTNGASTNSAERSLNALTEDPGTFTNASEQWACWTLAVYEGGADYVYRGNAGWAARYKGVRTDPQLYRGAKTLHP